MEVYRKAAQRATAEWLRVMPYAWIRIQKRADAAGLKQRDAVTAK